MKSIITVPFEINQLEKNENYRTYRLDLKEKRISGMVNGKDALVQSIWKILSTCRMSYLIYDDCYGTDIFRKINDRDLTLEYLESDIPNMIEDTLVNDERITEISDIKYQILNHDSVHISFTVRSIYGDLEVEGVMKNGN